MTKPDQLVDQIIHAVQTVTGASGTTPVALHEPLFDGNEWRYLKECLDSNYVSSVGKFVNQFEHELADYTGAKFAIAVVNGTAALHVALLLAGVVRDDEVLIPSLTFIATANATSYIGATPHFVDCNERTLGVDPVALRAYLKKCTEIRNKVCFNINTGQVIRALVPMHTFGHPADIEGLLAVAHDFHLVLIEDAAESLGSRVNGRHTGTFGLMGALSFNGNKVITTGGGGAILCNDEQLARNAKHLTTTAKLPHGWAFSHDQIGFNYRMPNINAALGCAQLEQLDSFLAAKRALYEKYKTAFADIAEVKLVQQPNHCTSNYWLQTLLLNKAQANLRDIILNASHDQGLLLRPAWQLLHTLPPYQHCPHMPLTVAKSLEQRIINLPSSVGLNNA
jgi:aminotransferase in exopolysaccharide biosynthesis